MKTGIDGQDRRKDLRREIAATAIVLTVSKARYVGTYLARNLSAGGTLLIGDTHLKVGERVKVLLQVQGLSAMALTAKVVSQQFEASGEAVFAIAFLDVPPEVEKSIADLVAISGPQSAAAERQGVLVLDDSSEICRSLERDLRMLGRQVVTTMNVLEAMAVIHTRQPRLETVIVDARLGNADGLEFLTFLSHHDPLVRRVLMSGELRPAQLALAKSSKRAHGVLSKPWNTDSLRRVLEA
jgi:CheY-like chemotaxis protein